MDALKFSLLPFSWLYGAGVHLRNKCFDWGIYPSRALGSPTISVGNLSVGGTGKTPLVAYVARYFRAKGKRVAILSRGYKRETSGFVLVSDGRNVFANVNESGDEPQELARLLLGVMIAVDEKRVRGGRIVLDRYAADVFVLDDAFQHRAVKRNLDVVTLPLGLHEVEGSITIPEGPLLPAGRRREPMSSLQRAQHIVFTRAGILESRPDEIEMLRGWSRRYTSADISAANFRPKSLVHLPAGEEESLDWIRGKGVHLFCGIGDPESFSRLVAGLGVSILGRTVFPDHHSCRVKDFEILRNVFNRERADCFLTTMKDAARLSGSSEGISFLKEFPVLGVAIDVHFVFGEEIFHQHLNKLIP